VLSTFHFDCNYFTFADLELFISNTIANFSYSPQNQIPVYPRQVNYSAGDTMGTDITELTTYGSGAADNRYRWWKDGLPLTSYSESPVLSIPMLEESDEGYYYCTITNSNWPDLVLTTDSVRLVINGPVQITLTNNSIFENQEAGAVIGTFDVTDPDQSAGHAVILAAGNGINDVDNALFTSDGENLSINVVCDYETKTEYFIHTRTVDNESQTLDVSFVISVLDVSDGPEVELSENTIDENCNPGTLTGILTVTDPNQESGHILTLTDGISANEADNDKFTIEDLELRIMVSPDYETQSEYNIMVRAVDDENQVGDFHFLIGVNDLAEGVGLEVNLSERFKVYPNPVYQDLFIEYSLESENEIMVKLVDMQGRLYHLSYLKRSAGKHRETIKINEILATGGYMLYIISDDYLSLYKIFIKTDE
jgi:hypothetical protein